MIPWRIKSMVSDRFPLLYHFVANLGIRGNSAQHWDKSLADAWDAPIAHWPTKNALLKSLISPSETVIDIGCGTGSILRFLIENGYENLHGLEISGYAIKRLAAAGIKMHYGRLPRIPLADESFDAVIVSQVLEHVIRRKTFLGEVRRILKPKGKAFIFVPDNCLGPVDELEHVVKFNAHSLRSELEQAFSITSLSSMKDTNHDMSVLFAHVVKI